MADGREDESATFQFIDEVQNCPDLWDVSSAEYNNTKSKQKKLLDERVVRYIAQISPDIRFSFRSEFTANF